MATTAKELIEQIKKWFPDENELVHCLGIVSKTEFREMAYEQHDLPEDWVMPDDVFHTISNSIDSCDNSLEHLWEDINSCGDEAISDYVKQKAEAVNDEALWEEETHE
jgi:hypothetical protein